MKKEFDCIQYMCRCRCLTNDILTECAYDYNTDTREYARKLLKRRGIIEY